MKNNLTTKTFVCQNCGNASSGNYCNICGQSLKVKSITISGIAHEVFHYFTHFDKGFGYTLKQLIKHPGSMQRGYMAGHRSNHQKPFSMFFICGTLAGLGYYLINVAVKNIYGESDATEGDFFRNYFVLLHALMLPIYALITWLIFKNEKYNYAETLVMLLYNLAFVFLILIPINAIDIIFPDAQTEYIELFFLLIYNLITNFNFYSGKKIFVILKTLVILACCYFTAQLVKDVVVELLR